MCSKVFLLTIKQKSYVLLPVDFHYYPFAVLDAKEFVSKLSTIVHSCAHVCLEH